MFSIFNRDLVKQTLSMRSWATLKVPLLALVAPRVEENEKNKMSVSIPLNRLTKNHLNSMYIAVLVMGADIAGGAIVLREIKKKKLPLSLVFADFNGKFLRRAEGRCTFVCEGGQQIRRMMKEAMTTGERITESISIQAFCDDKNGEPELVATFDLGLSLKKKKGK